MCACCLCMLRSDVPHTGRRRERARADHVDTFWQPPSSCCDPISHLDLNPTAPSPLSFFLSPPSTRLCVPRVESAWRKTRRTSSNVLDRAPQEPPDSLQVQEVPRVAQDQGLGSNLADRRARLARSIHSSPASVHLPESVRHPLAIPDHSNQSPAAQLPAWLHSKDGPSSLSPVWRSLPQVRNSFDPHSQVWPRSPVDPLCRRVNSSLSSVPPVLREDLVQAPAMRQCPQRAAWLLRWVE